MSSPPIMSAAALDAIQLEPDALLRAAKEGRKEGVFAGLTAALASAHIGSKFMGLKRYPTIACGIITAITSGYYFTQAFTDSHLRRLKQESLTFSPPPAEPEIGDRSV